MRKQTIFPIISCLFMLSIIGCKSKFDEKKYLMQILNNLEQVKSASYLDTRGGHQWYTKEFANPADTAAGVSYAVFFPTDTTLYYLYYDGNAYVHIEDNRIPMPNMDNRKRIVIDSLKNNVPVRSVDIFFNSIKNIIKYALNPNDSILKEFHDYGDSLLFRLTVYSDKMVNLNSKKPTYIDGKSKSVFYINNPTPRDKILEYNTSQYDIWINKTTGLPYKLGKNLSNMLTSWNVLSDIQINKMDIKDFIPSRLLPADYEIYVWERETMTSLQDNLTGKIAPDWILSDYNNESFALKDFKSKVLLLQFSGIGCAPCHASLPFLKKLVVDYENKSFELVRIECWSNNIDVIKKYCSTNDIKYKFLLKDNEIDKKYNVFVVPTLFILDNNRVIQKVVRGYSSELEKEIREAIEKLL